MIAPTPMLSVIVPVYGVQAYLAECLWSILRQPLDLEVIVVDDASVDASGGIAREFARSDPRVRVLRHPENRGLGAARNTGLDAARGHYVTFPDSDDLVVDGAYARAVESLERTGSDFVTGPAEEFGASVRKRYWTTRSSEFDVRRERTSLAVTPGLIRDHTAWTKVFRRSFLVAAQIRWPEGVKCEDLLPSAQAYAQAGSVDVLREPMYLYRRRPGSITTSLGVARTLSDWATQTAAVLRLLKGSEFGRALAEFANKAVTTELVSRLQPLVGADAQTVRTCAELARELIEIVPASRLAELAAETRWELALLVLGQSHLLPLVRDPRLRPEVSWRDVSAEPLPSSLADALGLGGQSVRSAFESRFLPGRAPSVPTGRAHEVGPASQPDISVVVPTHNVEEYIDELLRSLRSAAQVRHEVIVVDDSSTDQTWEIVQRHVAEDPRVRAVRSSGRSGGQAREVGIELARGEYLAFADGDDLVPPNAYSALLTAARETQADIVTGSYLKFFPTTTWDGSRTHGYSVRFDDISLSALPQLLRHRVCWNRLIRTDFWRKNALPFPSVPRANDIVPITSALTAASSITVIPQITYIYRARPGVGSMSATLRAASSTASYLSEEVTCALLVDQAGDEDLSNEYWSAILTKDCWTHLRHYLDARRERELPDDDVPAWLGALLDLAPERSLRALPPGHQAVYALTRYGDASAAAHLCAAVVDSENLPPGTALGLLEKTVATGALGPQALAALSRRLLLRKVIDERSTLTERDAELACTLARSLAHEHGIVLPTIPATWEDRAWAALRQGTSQDVLAVLRSKAPSIPAVLDVGFLKTQLHGEVTPGLGRYLRVTAYRKTKRQVLRVPLGPVVYSPDNTRWVAELRSQAIPQPGRWEIGLEAEDEWGPRRLRVRVRRGSGRRLLSRLTTFGPSSSRPSSTIWVRAPLIRRVVHLVAQAVARRG